MKLGWKIALMGVVLGILVLFALGLGNDPRFIPSPLVNRPAPLFTATTLDGQPIALADYRSKWVVVNFWGSWCSSCISEHPVLIDLAAKARNHPDLAIIGIDFRDSIDGAKGFLNNLGDPGYPQVFDPQQKIAIDWGVYGAPESYIVDPAGQIRYKQTGPIYPGWFESVLLPLMQTGGKS